MSGELSARFGSVNRLADQIQDAINEGAWQRAAELERLRLAALESLIVAHSQPDGDAAALAHFLDASQALVHRQIGEIKHHQRRVVREAETIRTGRCATASYERTADACER